MPLCTKLKKCDDTRILEISKDLKIQKEVIREEKKCFPVKFYYLNLIFWRKK